MAKKKRVYKARPNTPLKDADAQIIGNFLDENFPDDEYTPEQVVNLARDSSSPIHKYFEWDNTKAAEAYRLQQARKVITCVVEIIGDQEVPKAVSVYVAEHRVYMDTTKAKDIPDIWSNVLGEAMKGLMAWKRRYETFKQLHELKPLFAEIDNLQQELEEKAHGTSEESSRSSRHESQPQG